MDWAPIARRTILIVSNQRHSTYFCNNRLKCVEICLVPEMHVGGRHAAVCCSCTMPQLSLPLSLKDGSGATVHNRDSNEVVTSMADGITEPSGGSQHGAPSDHKITSLVQAASKALSATSGQQQSPSGPAVKTEKTHSHFPNDDLGSEAGVVSVKEELPPVNSVTHAVAGRGSYRQGGAGLSPTLPSTPGQGTLKSASLPSSTAGKTQVSGWRGGERQKGI